MQHPLGIFASVLFATLAGVSHAQHSEVSLRYIDEWQFEPRAEYLGTRIGGISGIDYDPDWGYLVILSDDPGRYAPARAYLGHIELNAERIVGIDWTFLQRLVWATGDLMEGRLDPEGIRIMPHGDPFGDPTLMVVSEGDAKVGGGPRIYEVCSGATRMDEWPAPKTHVPGPRGFGVKNNRAFESIAMVGPKLAVVGTEEPLQQDGPGATEDTPGWVRLSTYSFARAMTEPIAEIVYPLGPKPASIASAATGLSDLLGLADGRLLAVERTLMLTGTFRIDLYVVDPAGATDVLGRESLRDAEFTTATKSHIATLNDLAPNVMNIEGVCFGPTLEDGTLTLLCVSDSNFLPGVPTIFTAFAIEDDGGVLRPATLIAEKHADQTFRDEQP